MWQSGDPILEKYLPTGDRERDRRLPGMGGVYNLFNLGMYSYSHLNPIRFVDPDGNAAGDPFKSAAAAAADFGKTYNDDSIRNNVEYGAAIYSFRDKDGNKTAYSYNVPNRGNSRSVTIDKTAKPGQRFETTVHSHANYNPDLDKSLLKDGIDGNNVPSGAPFGDRAKVGANPEYVTTPNGSLIQYDRNSSNDKVIRTDMPSSPHDPGRLNKVDPYKNRVDDPAIRSGPQTNLR